MAKFYSDQLQKSKNTPVEFNRETDQHGKQRTEYFKFTAPAGMSAADTIELATLLRGRVRILFNESFLHVDDVAAATITMDLGYRAFETPDGSTTAEAADAFDKAVDISGGLDAVPGSELDQPKTWVAESRQGITVFATLNTAALAEGEVIEGYITYMSY